MGSAGLKQLRELGGQALNTRLEEAYAANGLPLGKSGARSGCGAPGLRRLGGARTWVGLGIFAYNLQRMTVLAG
jgi:hypothetical protein